MNRQSVLLSGWLILAAAGLQAQFVYTTNNGAITITGSGDTNGAVVIPDQITGLPVRTIGDNAFRGNSFLTSITFPDTLTSIGNQAFFLCTGLTNVSIGSAVSSIGSNAFAYCSSLTSVTIPGSVTSIGSYPFAQCASLTLISADASNPAYSSVDGDLFNKSQTTLIEYPGGKAGSYAIPENVISIGNQAFSGCGSLTGVAIPDSVTEIGYLAFGFCSSLSHVMIGANVTRIGFSAFILCTNLAKVTMPDSVSSIGVNAFYDCTSLTGVTLGNSVANIADGLFYGCASLTNVAIPNSVTSIGNTAFYDCSGLSSVTIGTNVTTIGNQAFYDCTSLTNATIPGSVTNIGYLAFYGCPFSSITIPSSVAGIGTNAFVGPLTKVYFQGNAPSADSSVFAGDKATAYYLPGTTGWGATFGGLPTALWIPQLETTDSQFGLKTNAFGFSVNWASGRTVVVEASTDLANPIWSPVQTNNLTGGAFYFADPQWTNHSKRFYRIRWP